LDQVKAVAVESWLSTLKKDDGTTLADGSKKKIRDLMHLLYGHAIRYEWTDRNPITSVRQSGVRQATPIRLSVEQLSQLIYGELKQRERVMVLLDFGTGLRRGELSGVRWEDVCFDDKLSTPKRSIVKQRIGKVKTEVPGIDPLNSVAMQSRPQWRFVRSCRAA
jgi:site-specific recombinase XerD